MLLTSVPGVAFATPKMDESERPKPKNFNPDDVFDVYYPRGAEYHGYSFRFVAGVTFSIDDVENIHEFGSGLGLCHAPTPDDVRSAFEPEQIEWIEISATFYAGGPPAQNHFNQQWIISVIAGTSNGFDGSYYDNTVEHESERPKPRNFNPDDVFDVYYHGGAEYSGYNFRPVEGTMFSINDAENIYEVWSELGIYHAPTLEDIRAAFDPEQIEWVAINAIFYAGPPEIAETLVPPFAPDSYIPADDSRTFAGINDPRFREQWNLEFIRGAAIWTAGLSASDIIVAVLDTGLNAAHEEFAGANIRDGRSFAPNTAQGDTHDQHGHGTMVTGIIAARRGNGVGIASMVDGVTIMPVRLSVARAMRPEDIADGILHAARNGAHIINMSFGGDTHSTAIETAVNYAHARGVRMIAAVGNYGGTTRMFPASFDNVIGVGSVDRHGVRPTSSQRSSVFVVVPGTTILSTGILNRAVQVNNSYSVDPDPRAGTSYAAPHVTALAAIARAYCPTMSIATFRNLLERSAIPRNEAHTGHGMIDVARFVRLLTFRDFFNFNDVGPHVPGTNWARNYINSVVRNDIFSAVNILWRDIHIAPYGYIRYSAVCL